MCEQANGMLPFGSPCKHEWSKSASLMVTMSVWCSKVDPGLLLGLLLTGLTGLIDACHGGSCCMDAPASVPLPAHMHGPAHVQIDVIEWSQVRNLKEESTSAMYIRSLLYQPNCNKFSWHRLQHHHITFQPNVPAWRAN